MQSLDEQRKRSHTSSSDQLPPTKKQHTEGVPSSAGHPLPSAAPSAEQASTSPRSAHSSNASMSDHHLYRPFDGNYQLPLADVIEAQNVVFKHINDFKSNAPSRNDALGPPSQLLLRLTRLPPIDSLEVSPTLRELEDATVAQFILNDAKLSKVLDRILENKIGYLFDREEDRSSAVIATLVTYLYGKRIDAQRAKKVRSPAVMKNVVAAWKSEYRSGSEHALLRAIRQGYRAMQKQSAPYHYANTLSIVQSSGTGKSRTVHEMSKMIFTIPFNLREDDAGFAYPPPDSTIRNYMLKISDDLQVTQRYEKLLGGVFARINQWCATKTLPASYGETVRAWSEFVEQHRDSFYADVLDHLHDTIDVEEELGNLLKFLSTLLFSEKSGKARQTQDVVLVIYFDEANCLTETRHAQTSTKRPQKSRYELLLTVFDEWRHLPLFGVFLSTSSLVARFAPPAAKAPSARYAASPLLQAPFTELPFDCHASLLNGTLGAYLTRVQVSTISFMAMFGRPLFWSMLEADLDSERQRAEKSIVELAQSKLLAHEIDPDWKNYTQRARAAVLDLRLSFGYELRRRNTIEHLGDLIAMHLRLAYSAPVHREYVISGYSSEPLLAEAAARNMRQMMDYKTIKWSAAWELTVLLDDGMLDWGLVGELLGRLLLTRAYDEAMMLLIENGGSTRFSAGCTVSDFIIQLFPNDVASRIATALPDNVPAGSSPDFRSSFGQGYVRFTQWVKLGDASGFTTSALRAAFIRGVAFIVQQHHERVNLIVPVLLDDTKPITNDNMSAILIQIKDRGVRGTVAKYAVTAEDLELFADSDEDGSEAARVRPYCTLLMDLGVRKPPSGSTTVPAAPLAKSTKPDVQIDEPRSARAPRAVEPRPSVHPRFSIRAYGCSKSVYAVISDEEEIHYRDMLVHTDFLAEHPRKETLKDVWNTKPLWVASKRDGIMVDSYDWAGPPSTLVGDEGDCDEVQVGEPSSDVEID